MAGFSATQLLMQGVGVVVIAVWAVVATYVTFTVADVTMGLRVSDEDEFEGLDRSEHGSVAYPEFVESGSSGAPAGAQAVATDGGEAE